MAYVSKSTSMLAFLCEAHVPNKGWSFVSDQVGMTKYILTTAVGKKLKEKGLCYIRCLVRQYDTPIVYLNVVMAVTCE